MEYRGDPGMRHLVDVLEGEISELEWEEIERYRNPITPEVIEDMHKEWLKTHPEEKE